MMYLEPKDSKVLERNRNSMQALAVNRGIALLKQPTDKLYSPKEIDVCQGSGSKNHGSPDLISSRKNRRRQAAS